MTAVPARCSPFSNPFRSAEAGGGSRYTGPSVSLECQREHQHQQVLIPVGQRSNTSVLVVSSSDDVELDVGEMAEAAEQREAEGQSLLIDAEQNSGALGNSIEGSGTVEREKAQVKSPWRQGDACLLALAYPKSEERSDLALSAGELDLTCSAMHSLAGCEQSGGAGLFDGHEVPIPSKSNGMNGMKRNYSNFEAVRPLVDVLTQLENESSVALRRCKNGGIEAQQKRIVAMIWLLMYRPNVLESEKDSGKALRQLDIIETENGRCNMLNNNGELTTGVTWACPVAGQGERTSSSSAFRAIKSTCDTESSVPTTASASTNEFNCVVDSEPPPVNAPEKAKTPTNVIGHSRRLGSRQKLPFPFLLKSRRMERRHSGDCCELRANFERKRRGCRSRLRHRKSFSEETMGLAASHAEQLLRVRDGYGSLSSASPFDHPSPGPLVYRRCRSAVTMTPNSLDASPTDSFLRGDLESLDQFHRKFSLSSLTQGADSEVWPDTITSLLTNGQSLGDRAVLFSHLDALFSNAPTGGGAKARCDTTDFWSGFRYFTPKEGTQSNPLGHEVINSTCRTADHHYNSEGRIAPVSCPPQPSRCISPSADVCGVSGVAGDSRTYVEDAQDQGRSESSLQGSVAAVVTPKRCSGLRLRSAGVSIPRLDKKWGGEDAFFTCDESDGFLGVADGVGEWGELGCNPRQFAEELMEGAKSEALILRSERWRPKKTSKPPPIATGEESAGQQGCGNTNNFWSTTASTSNSKYLREGGDGSFRSDGSTRASSSSDGHEEKASQRALRVLRAGFRAARSFGSSTAIIVGLDAEGRTLGIANIGDSSCIVLRRESKKHRHFVVSRRTKEQQHFFNCPYQLSRVPTRDDLQDLAMKGMHGLVRVISNPNSRIDEDTPEMADLYDVRLLEGDLILLASDGVFDNLFDHEISGIVSLAISPYEGNLIESNSAGGYRVAFMGGYPHPHSISPPEFDDDFGLSTPPVRIAKAIAEAAFYRSLDPRARTPFSRQSRRAGGFFSGGKMDDVTVVASWVV